MNEYDFLGPVHTIEQRPPDRFSSSRIAGRPDHEAFDAEFSSTGKVLRQTDYTYGLQVYQPVWCVYNNCDQLIRTFKYDAAGVERSVAEYEYSDGRCRWIERDRNGVTLLSGDDEYAGDLPIVLSVYGPTGKPRHVKLFTYTSGRLAQAESRHFGPTGELVERSISKCDADGRVIEAFGLKPDGIPNGDGRYTYEYDECGRKLRVLSYNHLADVKTPNRISEFGYALDDRGNWIERTESSRFAIEKKWTNRITTRQLTYYD